MFYARKHAFGPVQGFEVGVAPTGKPVKSVYLYRVGSIIIDTGPFHLRKHVGKMLDGSDVTSILLTHHHEDHSGNAALLHRRFKAPVFLHPYGVAKLSNGFNILPYQHILFGKAPPLKAQTLPEIIESEHINLRAIHTPGHSRDHAVYLVKEEGWLFSGDIWVGEKIQFFRVDEHIDQQIESLRNITKFDFESLFCGHRPCLTNGPALIRRKLDYLVSFKQQVTDLFQQGIDQKEIVLRLRRKNDLPIRLFTMGNASFSHMVRSSLHSFSVEGQEQVRVGNSND